MTLNGRPICVLALETAHSANDCKYCGKPKDLHTIPSSYCTGVTDPPGHFGDPQFAAIGWDNRAALGLSIGCWWDSRDERIHWFDVHTLEETVRHFVKTQPLLVSFNGISFDFVLMRGLLMQHANDLRAQEAGFGIMKAAHDELQMVCNDFKTLCTWSYDILAEIWQVDPSRRFEHGLNSLDAISRANGFGGKLSHGAEAPRRWASGEYAHVLNYRQDNVLKTRALFEMVCAEQSILRGDHQPIVLRNPFTPGKDAAV